MKKRIEKTWLPIFPGFYGTVFEPSEDNEIQYLNDIRVENGLSELDYNAFDSIGFDYKEYYSEVAKKCTAVVCDELMRLGFINSYEFDAIDSPKEYNFRNDSINVSLGYSNKNAKALYAYVKLNLDSFTQHVKEHCSSRDGFISFHSNQAVEWLLDTKNFQRFDDMFKLGFVLEWALVHSLEVDEPYYWLYENIVDYATLHINDFTKATELNYCIECDEFIVVNEWVDAVNMCKECALELSNVTTPINIIAKGGDFVYDSEIVRKVNSENGTDFKGLWQLNGVYYGSPTSLPSTDVVLVSI